MMRALLVVLALGMLEPVAAVHQGGRSAQRVSTSARTAVYIVFYWRAKPGQADAYNEYIRTVAVPIDEDARRAGAFEEVRTVTPAAGVTTDWTHLRIFRLKNADAARGLGAALDSATARIVPDEARRKANSERAATLRDFVRQEIWTELR